MSDTTSLADLPSDPSAGGGSQNVVLQTTDKPTTYDPNSGIGANNSIGANSESSEIQEQKMMNELVAGIQQASASGATTLPSRDIPMNAGTVNQDPAVQPNFVPENFLDKGNSDFNHDLFNKNWLASIIFL